MKNEKILFVDDEPAALEGYRRLLYRDFTIDTAVGGREGLSQLTRNGPYAVVVSDMRMPDINGAEFLTRVRAASPETVRIAITGYADINDATHAINEGRILLFLSKPCQKETLSMALTTAVEQHRLVRAEKDLLEKTLRGSVKMLAAMLSLSNPAAFSRASRICQCVKHIVDKLGLTMPWNLEVAATLSQIGCATLAPELIEAYYAGSLVSDADQSKIDQHPLVAARLIADIPRMEQVAWMIAHMNSAVSDLDGENPKPKGEVILGAKVLAVAAAYDRLISQGVAHHQATARLHSQHGRYEPAIVDRLQGFHSVESTTSQQRECQISDLAVGMILRDEVRTLTGLLVVAKGQEVTAPMLIRLKNFEQRKSIPGKFLVTVPAPEAARPLLGALGGTSNDALSPQS